jgi:multiple sugar transport system ATP-binding protein
MGNLTLDRVTKRFGEVLAVDDVSLDIDEGEFLVLVGPSGCGKSTTLRCLAGLETVSSGEILIDDIVVNDKKPKDRDIAMVFQNYALYPHMTARENMSFGLKMTTEMPESDVEAAVDDVAAVMGIEDLLDKKPRQLSGGQQQRVALGRAIVREPEVFLLDEPLSNLDAKLRTTMRTELQNLQQELGVTTVYVTHDQTEAMTMGDRIAILNGGQLQQVGTPLECYHEPANRFVAGFIGSPSMNFMDVSLRRSPEGPTTLVHEAFEYDLTAEFAAGLETTADRLTLGIRPEDVRLARTDEAGTVAATVSVTEPLGDQTYVNVEIDDETYTVSVPGGLDLETGTRVELVMPESSLHLFDRETGTAVVNRAPPDRDLDQFRSPESNPA